REAIDEGAAVAARPRTIDVAAVGLEQRRLCLPEPGRGVAQGAILGRRRGAGERLGRRARRLADGLGGLLGLGRHRLHGADCSLRSARSPTPAAHTGAAATTRSSRWITSSLPL